MIAAEEDANTSEIISVLERGLTEHFGEQCRVGMIRRQRSEYGSSFAIEELEIKLHDGRHVAVIFKQFSEAALLDQARRTRPAFLYNPVREICVYRDVLCRLGLGTATCYATEINRSIDRYWLFLEKVIGRELYQVGEFEIWQGVARWLAQLHSSGAETCDVEEDVLLHWNIDHYHRSLESAETFGRQRTNVNPAVAPVMSRVARAYQQVIAKLLELPCCFIHGEFYASNIMIGDSDGAVRVCPIDWETAAVGPALIDLAALVAGKWLEHQRTALVESYWNALTRPQQKRYGGFSSFQTALVFCRLHLAMMLLGRPPEWDPPPEHKHDWLQEAHELVGQLSW
jgi:hypothetical protein